MPFEPVRHVSSRDTLQWVGATMPMPSSPPLLSPLYLVASLANNNITIRDEVQRVAPNVDIKWD
eukprot:3243256-Prymnesium_polylepis.3